jgi:nucleoid-associated protein YgaU
MTPDATPDTTPRRQPTASPTTDRTATRRPSRPAPNETGGTRTTPPGTEVVVRPGDSLWLIAARRIGLQPSAAQVAAAWPQWYATNRDTIGDDPNLIRPGQVLQVPADVAAQDSP